MLRAGKVGEGWYELVMWWGREGMVRGGSGNWLVADPNDFFGSGSDFKDQIQIRIHILFTEQNI